MKNKKDNNALNVFICLINKYLTTYVDVRENPLMKKKTIGNKQNIIKVT